MKESDKKKLAELVKKFQNGDIEAFNEIFMTTYGYFKLTANGIVNNIDDADDVLQESYLKFYNKKDLLDDPEKFWGWFSVIVTNTARDFLRKKRPELYSSLSVDDDEGNELPFEELIEEERMDFIPEDVAESEDIQKIVSDLIFSLSDEKRTAVVLHLYNGMTMKEISESLGVSENTIKSRYYQAQKDIEKGIKELEKKGCKFRAVAPIPLVIWALNATAKSASAASIASGAAASSLAATTSAVSVVSAMTTATTASATVAATTSAGATTASAAGGAAAKTVGFSVAQKSRCRRCDGSSHNRYSGRHGNRCQNA